MEFIIISFIVVVTIVVLKYVFDYNTKILKHIGENDELDELAKKYPSNTEMCKEYLKMLNNEKVKIEENNEAKSSLYIAITNKIIIANIQKSYTRIQTIAHECLHSIQNRKLLLFNFIFSNIYLLYFIIACILVILRIPYKTTLLSILFIFSMVYYMVRVYLENDAMIKARFLAKEYMENKRISSKEEIEKFVKEFDRINSVGIKSINYNLFLEMMIKILIFTALCFII